MDGSNKPPFGSPWPALLFDFFQILHRLTSKSPHAWWITPLTSPQPQQTAERCIAEGFLWASKEAPQLSQVPRGDLDLLTLSGGHPKVYPWQKCIHMFGHHAILRVPMAERLLTHDFPQVIRCNQVGGKKTLSNSSLSSRQREIINHPLVSTVRSIQLYN